MGEKIQRGEEKDKEVEGRDIEVQLQEKFERVQRSR